RRGDAPVPEGRRVHRKRRGLRREGAAGGRVREASARQGAEWRDDRHAVLRGEVRLRAGAEAGRARGSGVAWRGSLFTSPCKGEVGSRSEPGGGPETERALPRAAA